MCLGNSCKSIVLGELTYYILIGTKPNMLKLKTKSKNITKNQHLIFSSIIKLISQLQKPTRKISDTWIIDTGKRETRY